LTLINRFMQQRIFTWAQYSFWHLKLRYPDDNWNEKRTVLAIGAGRVYIQIPLWKASPWNEWDRTPPQYGISYHDSTFWLYYGADRWFAVDMPWSWRCVRHDLLLPNGTVFRQDSTWNETFEQNRDRYDELQRTVAEFVRVDRYTENFDQQSVRIRLTGEEREWRWKWLRRLPFPRRIRRTILCVSDEPWGDARLPSRTIEWQRNESMIGAFHRWYKTWDGE
jgi:hypothetical protein